MKNEYRVYVNGTVNYVFAENWTEANKLASELAGNNAYGIEFVHEDD